MTELYQSLKLKQNPFSKFSAEEELEYLSKIYVSPKYFNTLFSDLKSGSSRFIIGSRGSGKTALLNQLMDNLRSENVYVHFFDEYDGIPIKSNGTHFLYRVIQTLVTDFCFNLSQNRRSLKKLSSFEKEKLSFFVSQFFKTLSRREYEERNNAVKKFKTKNFFKKIFNQVFNSPINFLLSGAVQLIGDTVSSSLGLPSNKTTETYKNYLTKFKIETPSQTLSVDDFDYKDLKGILTDLAEIIKKSGYINVTVLFDKIDEYKELHASISHVSDFVQELLSDTKLLMTNNLSLTFSLWDEVRNELASRGIRFDKFTPKDVTWTGVEILQILNQRITYFGSQSSDIKSLLETPEQLSELIVMTNFSPRDMLHLFGAIYDEQAQINSNAVKFSSQSVDNGKMKFCKEYEYYALFPSKKNTKEDIFRNINRILKNGKTVFRANDLIASLKVSAPSANAYIKVMADLNLIKMTAQQYVYEVSDPKLIFLINNGINEI